MKQKKAYYIGALLAVLGMSTLIQLASAKIDERGVLNPGEYFIDSFTLNNRTTVDREELESRNIYIFNNGEKWIDFQAEGPLSLYLANETEMASLVSLGTFNAKYSETNTTSVNLQITYEGLLSNYGFEPVLKEDLVDD